jgi:hypothetical protein
VQRKILRRLIFQYGSSLREARSVLLAPRGFLFHEQEELMAKGQKHGNREIKKPKQKKEAVTAPVVSTKIAAVLGKTPKKGT